MTSDQPGTADHFARHGRSRIRIMVVRCKPLTKDHLSFKAAFSGPNGVVVSHRVYCMSLMCTCTVICRLIGHGDIDIMSREAAMKVKTQNKIIAQFAEQKINILIATRVAEEGLDIRKCNLVVRFDPLQVSA